MALELCIPLQIGNVLSQLFVTCRGLSASLTHRISRVKTYDHIAIVGHRSISDPGMCAVGQNGLTAHPNPIRPCVGRITLTCARQLGQD
jgi:hypothetical protein